MCGAEAVNRGDPIHEIRIRLEQQAGCSAEFICSCQGETFRNIQRGSHVSRPKQGDGQLADLLFYSSTAPVNRVRPGLKLFP